jgi:FYVE zinc finger
VTEKGEISLWRLIFSSKENTEKWLNKLKKVVRPEWEDPKSKYCTVCSKEFGIFRRQHHCRKCGKVICGSHSVIIKSLEELGYMSRVRICTNCVNRIGNIDGIQRAKSLVQKEKEKNSTLFPNSFLGFAANGSLLTNNR